MNFADIEGKQDLYFTRRKIAVFVHGCYWHRHKGCQYAYTPKFNVDFWVNKLEGNRRHDEIVLSSLNEQDIRVLIIWECSVKRMCKDVAIEKQLFLAAREFIFNKATPFLEL